MADPSAVLCIRVADARHHAPGSIRVPCSECSADCWRSPSSPAELPVICLVCAQRMGGFELVAPTESQCAEILAHFARGQA